MFNTTLNKNSNSGILYRSMVLNATFNNNSVISWQSVLLVGENWTIRQKSQIFRNQELQIK